MHSGDQFQVWFIWNKQKKIKIKKKFLKKIAENCNKIDTVNKNVLKA